MKKLICKCVVLALFCFSAIACNEHESIYFDDLPAVTQTFILKYFPDNKVAYVERHSQEPCYEVTLDNGYEIDFYKDGTWQSIDSRHAILPADLIDNILPENIRSYLQQQWATYAVCAVERSESGYNVELYSTPEVTIYFDSLGNATVEIGD